MKVEVRERMEVVSSVVGERRIAGEWDVQPQRV
jgi:hypothetical protein